MPETVEANIQPVESSAEHVEARRGALADFIDTTKPGITKLVTITSVVGFGMSLLARAWRGEIVITPTLPLIAACLGAAIGTALTASCANALNQVMERDRDALMIRTRSRAVAAGRLSAKSVSLGAILLGVLGTLLLIATCGIIPAAVSTLTVLSYLLVYTPMKPVSTWSTIVGAVPGALPTLIGWTAGAGIAATAEESATTAAMRSLGDAGGWSLFSILFVWQIPHFMAIAWKYREDYAKGGYRVLPVVDKDGTRTPRSVMIWTALMIPASLWPVLATGSSGFSKGVLGPVYAAAALLLGAWFAWKALRFVRERSDASARGVFIASVIYLPLLLMVMVADALGRHILMR